MAQEILNLNNENNTGEVFSEGVNKEKIFPMIALKGLVMFPGVTTSFDIGLNSCLWLLNRIKTPMIPYPKISIRWA